MQLHQNEMLLVTRYFSSGLFLVVYEYFVGIYKSTVLRIITKVSRVIASQEKIS